MDRGEHASSRALDDAFRQGRACIIKSGTERGVDGGGEIEMEIENWKRIENESNRVE